MKKIFTLISVAALLTNIANAQDFSSVFKSGPADATKLGQAYLEPLFRGFGNSLNGGWTNTAKTDGLLHFDLRISASGSFVPDGEKSFDYNQIGLSSAVGPTTAGQSTVTPTFGASSSTAGQSISIYSTDGTHRQLSTFTLPSGVTTIVPAPQLQLTIGLIQNTDVTLRLIPKISLGSVGSVDMIGFGVKHNIAQDFGKLIPFDLAVAFGYTRLNYNIGLTVAPPSGSSPKDAQQSTDFSNQSLQGHFSGVNVAAIISKKFLVITPFLSLGYSTASTNIGTIGNFPIVTGVNTAQQPVYTTYNNPVSIDETSISGIRADVGFEFNLAFFKLFGSYSMAQYQSVNAGIGFGF